MNYVLSPGLAIYVTFIKSLPLPFTVVLALQEIILVIYNMHRTVNSVNTMSIIISSW